MIDPTHKDIGRKVVYTGNRYPGGKVEEGVITSFNTQSVFVRYGNGTHGIATSRADLEWLDGRGDYILDIAVSSIYLGFQGDAHDRRFDEPDLSGRHQSPGAF